ncbi:MULTISPECIES: tyrosine-type recombinase/integrase [unclassified Microcoleus]|uniref:tyrosine-type recombinase/integrase n=1 Tax=unclassified Microcoleus TaxID=2642155 RepID=UPI002FD38404
MANSGVFKKFGDVSVEIVKGNYRLRWRALGRRFCLAIGRADTEAARIVAEGRAQEINADILFGRFDESLAKYSQIHADRIAASKKGLDLREVWEKYKIHQKYRAAKTTQKDNWRTVDLCLEKLTAEQLLLERSELLLPKLLQTYASGTIRRALASLNAACNWATEAKVIENNPYSRLTKQLPKNQQGDRSREIFTTAEIKKILAAFRADKAASFYADYIELLALTGFRPEEAIALSWDDLTAGENGKLSIRVNKAHSKGELKNTKTGDRRDFPCNPQLTKFLANLPKIPNLHNLIFPSPKGGYIDQHNFSGRYWLPIVRELAVSKKIKQYLPCYNLRHSFITRLVREGLDVATIAKLAGNSPKMIFEHYLSANSDLELPEF